MTTYTHDGLTLWYGTADAPAPKQGESVRDAVTITVGVQPPHPSNRVRIRYSVNGGPVNALNAILTSTDYRAGKQYFSALFPDLPIGATVHYAPVLLCGGRQTPNVAIAHALPSSFRYEGETPVQAPPLDLPPPGSLDRFPFRLDYLCRVSAQLNRKPEILGETPDGLKVDWYITGGNVVGPKLNAIVRAEGGDWMTIRRDGIGDLGVRATLDTHDGALIYVTTSGVIDFGEDGYHKFLQMDWPSSPTLCSSPRFLTAHPDYLWLNRLQCLGVGMVRMKELLVTYDLYAVL